MSSAMIVGMLGACMEKLECESMQSLVHAITYQGTEHKVACCLYRTDCLWPPCVYVCVLAVFLFSVSWIIVLTASCRNLSCEVVCLCYTEQKIKQNCWPNMMSGQVQSGQTSLDAVFA